MPNISIFAVSLRDDVDAWLDRLSEADHLELHVHYSDNPNPTRVVFEWSNSFVADRVRTACQDIPAQSLQRFPDVPPDHEAHDAIQWAAEVGVTTGYTDGTFKPARPLSKRHAVVFMERYYDEILGAQESADFTRADMMQVLYEIAGKPGSLGSEQPLGGPPASLGLDPFYAKYLDAGGIPVVSSGTVPDAALRRAGDIIDEMLSDRPLLRAALARAGVRVAVMARGSVASDLPEFEPDNFWDARTKGGGFGGLLVGIAEENLMCHDDDVFPFEDIFVHEFAHGIHFGAREWQTQDGTLHSRLEVAYEQAMSAGLWRQTYAATNVYEYWAEGVQSWYDLDNPPTPDHNEIDTRGGVEERMTRLSPASSRRCSATPSSTPPAMRTPCRGTFAPA